MLDASRGSNVTGWNGDRNAQTSLFLPRVYVNVPQPPAPEMLTLELPCTFTPNPGELRRLIRAGRLRTNPWARCGRPKNPFIGLSILLDLGLTGQEENKR